MIRLLLCSFIILCSSPAFTQHEYDVMEVEVLNFWLFGPETKNVFGAINKQGEVVIKLQYSALSEFGPDGAVAIRDSVYGFVFKDGKEKWIPGLQKLYRLGEKLAPAQKGDKWGFVNKKGRVVIPFLYDMVAPFNEGYAPVKINNQWKVIDKKGRYLLDGRFEFYLNTVYDSKLVFLAQDTTVKPRKKGLMDIHGNIIIPAQYDEVGSYFTEGLCHVRRGKQEGYVNKQGVEVFMGDVKYPRRAFYEGVTPAVKDRKTGYINPQNEVIIPFDYSTGGIFSEGLAAVSKDGKMGFINLKNEVVIPFDFKEAWQSVFHEGLSVVKDFSTGKFGYIDRSGQLVIPAIYDSALHFSEGLAYVKMGGKVSFINTKGDLILPFQYEEIWEFRYGLARFSMPK